LRAHALRTNISTSSVYAIVTPSPVDSQSIVNQWQSINPGIIIIIIIIIKPIFPISGYKNHARATRQTDTMFDQERGSEFGSASSEPGINSQTLEDITKLTGKQFVQKVTDQINAIHNVLINQAAQHKKLKTELAAQSAKQDEILKQIAALALNQIKDSPRARSREPTAQATPSAPPAPQIQVPNPQAVNGPPHRPLRPQNSSNEDHPRKPNDEYILDTIQADKPIMEQEYRIWSAWPKIAFQNAAGHIRQANEKNKITIPTRFQLRTANYEIFTKLQEIQHLLQIALVPWHLWPKRIAIELGGDFLQIAH
jgi:hypothetical protein